MNTENNLSPGHKAVLGLVALGLIMIIVSSFVHRVRNPSLTVHRQGAEQSEAMPMEMIGQLMSNLEQNPEDVKTLQALGRAFMSMEAWDRAAKFWQRLLKVDPEDKNAAHQLAMCYFRMQEFEQAVDILTKIISMDPESYHAHFNLGILYKHYLDDPEKARQHLQKIIKAEEVEDELREEARKELN